MPEPLWDTATLAEYLGLPVATLHQWSHRGIGPQPIRVGRHLRYRPEAVDSWLEQQAKSERSHSSVS
jgi:excisionase family DNA binding protein